MITADDIRHLVEEILTQQCELDDVEVKAAHLGTPSKLYDSFSALANRTGGGVLLFGLDEKQSFAIVGVYDANLLVAAVTNKATDEMEPPLRLHFAVAEIDGNSVVGAEVPEVLLEQKPCYYKAAGLQHGSYIRVGGTDRPMTEYEIFGYISNRQQQEHDRTIIADATLDDLDRGRLELYLDTLRATNPEAGYLNHPLEQVLKTLRVIREDQGICRPTLAGLLMFGIYPQSFEPQLVITFVQFYGIREDEPVPTGERFLDNRKFEGPIPQMIEAAFRHILAAMRKSTLITGLYHYEIPEYPRDAIREALINAVVHRDYSPYASSSYIQVRLFADRLEIVSPGCLYGSVTVETLGDTQSTRNRYLMRMAEDLHLVENRGSGITTMLSEMRKASLEPPVFEDKRNIFQVTFYNRHLLTEEIKVWLDSITLQPLSEQQRMALAFLRHRGRMTNSDYRHLNQVDVVTATRDLRGLVQKGAIAQHEARRWTYYTLSEIIQHRKQQLELPAIMTPEEQILAFITQNGSINNTECQTLLHYKRWEVKKVLKEMVNKGIIHQVGMKGRNVKYIIE